MQKLINWAFPRKKDILYDAAMESTKAISNLFKLYKEGDLDIHIDDHAFVKMFPNDPASPAMYWIDDKQYIIRYPAHSKPYSHHFKDKCKFIQCLSGKLFDANSNFKLFKGDSVKVYPKDNYSPYTMDETCYLRVCIGDCNSSIDQICK